ncbi:trafficking protein particle complex subunit 12-like isoform X2 [Oratosquilla oratoria]|uniref:trafficking protein particle complex subunit 12-like isoform X2 n=2 Tax=Oratosquilla oratoria TaxID=337810 RepID=UPI003F76B490
MVRNTKKEKLRDSYSRTYFTFSKKKRITMSQPQTNTPNTMQPSIKNYFNQSSSSVFDQLSSDSFAIPENTEPPPQPDIKSTGMEGDQLPVPAGSEVIPSPVQTKPDDLSGIVNMPQSTETENQVPTSPIGAVLSAAPGVTSPSAMMMSMTQSMFVGDKSADTSTVDGVTDKLQLVTIKEDSPLQSVSPVQLQTIPSAPAKTTADSLPVVSSPLHLGPPPSSTPLQPQAKESLTSHGNTRSAEPKLFNYFSTPKSVSDPFDLIGSQPGNGVMTSSTTILNTGNSTMMNPVYMSPTETFSLSNAIPSPDSFLTPATEQDVFTASLLSSDADRRHDAWIPCETTRQAIVAMVTSPPSTYFPEKELLTMPGIAVKEDFGDPVKNLVRTYLGEEAASKRQVMTAASVTQDDRGLRQLISAGCYHAAVNLTTQRLTIYGQGEGSAGHLSKHTAHSIQLWFTRIALLIKLRRFSLAEVECQHFGDLDAPDLYFEFYPELYGGRRGSMVPFSFRLLVAELPQYLGKHTQALDKLNCLLRTCNKILENLRAGLSEDGSNMEITANMREDSIKLWRARRLKVLYSITNCAVSLKDYRLAGSLIEYLVQEDPNNAGALCSAQGRLLLLLGDVSGAQEAFNRYLEYAPPPPRHDPVQGLLHSAYISIAQNAFKDAVDILEQAYKANPNSALVINNLGVCLMYNGRVHDAIALVEGAVMQQPERFLHEAIVLNLATMYELESSNAHQKKLKLLSLISQHKGDSFNVAALKLQPQ